MPIPGQPIAETTVQHFTRDDMINPHIAVQKTEFDQALTERSDYIKYIINDFDGSGIEDEDSAIPQWDT